MHVLDIILDKTSKNQKMLAVLLDPEKLSDSIENFDMVCEYINQSAVDFVFVGGSGYNANINEFVCRLRNILNIPIVLFPGDISQVCSTADALLFLSLMSGKNIDLIIGEHIKVAKKIKESGIETIPMGYILVDGGRQSTTQKVSKTEPLSDADIIVDTAIASELLGKKIVYLEAGSGAKTPVSSVIISSVKSQLSIPLIVGGGIRTKNQLQMAWQSGADIVVIGNFFEQHADQIPAFAQVKYKLNNHE